MRERIILACTECKQRNYVSKKNKQKNYRKSRIKEIL